ncbi:translation initiation factor eIF 4e-like domain-containing protein [Jimgerdemannia flammicorona]|uniref:Translation initiation factor eIF 4e-like domain-containing protein n=1 Tax=Jimgerdemannia flammicorona TaxID=994334 RepID=A0A433QFX0_9FUNG|nr:translation initiation factor eIF 4e-like domain-containing protein [Jimgerdemannia flammicorona]
MTDTNDSIHSRTPHRPLMGSASPSSPSTSSTLKSTNMHLSPAVSAFQFMGGAGAQKLGAPLVRSSAAPISRSLSSEGHVMSHVPSPLGIPSSSEMQRSVSGHDVMPTMSANDLPGYFAAKGKPQVEDRKKEELRKSAAIPLQNEWTFWLDKYVQGLSPAEYEQNLKIISTVGTVQAFWSVYNNIAGPDKLPFRSSLHFMKKGIKPIW